MIEQVQENLNAEFGWVRQHFFFGNCSGFNVLVRK